MAKTIAQRQRRNDNAKMIDALADGDTFVATRNSVPVAELRPIPTARRSVVPKTDLMALAAWGPHSDLVPSRSDLDPIVDPSLSMSTGRLDTSVVVDWDDPDVAAALSDEAAICAITLGELTARPHLASKGAEGAHRRARLHQVEAGFEPVPVDVTAARSYGQILAAVAETGRSRRRPIADLLIAATAHANGLILYPRNPDDFTGLGSLVQVVGI